jgi:hypothetical protein
VKSEICADHLEESLALLNKQKSSVKQLELIQTVIDRSVPRWRKLASQIHDKDQDDDHAEVDNHIDYDFEATL